MRVTLAIDGKKEEVEVPRDLDVVVVRGHRFPVKVVSVAATRVELEIAGEKVVVENWPDHFPSPPGPVDVNGERWKLTVERGAVESPRPRAADAPPAGPAPGTPSPSATAPSGSGVPVLPSMPGRVVEVRAKDGERVRKGDVLLVLEAMKMRNEVPSPADGVVRGIRVAPGDNARPSEPMMFVAPA